MTGSENFMKILLLLTMTFIIVSCGTNGSGNDLDNDSNDTLKVWSRAIADQGNSDSLFF